MEGLDGRLTGGELTLGAGTGAGAGRTAVLLPPDLDSLFSLAAKMGSKIKIKAKMSARVPILTAPRCFIANMICLLSVNGPERVLLLTTHKRPESALR